MTLNCARDACRGLLMIGDTRVVAFDINGSWVCPACGLKCCLPLDYIEDENEKTWWLVEDERA